MYAGDKRGNESGVDAGAVGESEKGGRAREVGERAGEEGEEDQETGKFVNWFSIRIVRSLHWGEYGEGRDFWSERSRHLV